jgi:hypothetical protein
MKKKIILATAAFLSVVAFTTSCTSDKKKGEKDGKAYCKCLEKADGLVDIDKCSDYLTTFTKGNAEYQEGFTLGAVDCFSGVKKSPSQGK